MRFIFVLGVFLAVLIAALPVASETLKEADSAFEERDYKRAFQLYMPLAEQGDLKAMVQVARMYKTARGVELNMSEAFRWYRSAARKGSMVGAYGQANMLYWGQGVEQDFKAAAYHYHQAAEKGHAEAARVLGTMYYQGQGLDKNMEQAAVWFRVGIERDSKQAKLWYNRMKREGHLSQDGTYIIKPEASIEDSPVSSVAKVSGEAGQTVTAVHTASSPVIAAQNVKGSSETEGDLSRTEYWAMAITGLAILLTAPLAFFSPKLFMYGRRSFFWRELLGERRTAVMIRVISIIVGLLGILLMFTGIYSNLKS